MQCSARKKTAVCGTEKAKVKRKKGTTDTFGTDFPVLGAESKNYCWGGAFFVRIW